jgi:two-component system, OmpR family, response regulator
MNTRNITVLVADDDSDYLFQMRVMLENAGFKVIAADSQNQAEEIIESVRPDLAILDLMMEKDDSGFILSYKIKKKYPDVPVILATAVSQETGISFGLDAEEDRSWIKADLYLEKGIRQDQLLMAIEKLLKR